jgi:phosphoglucomutase
LLVAADGPATAQHLRRLTLAHLVARRIQSLFSALGEEAVGKTIGLGGDGRYFNKEAVQTILRVAAGNGVAKVVVGKDAIMATPAMSALIRRRGLYGGLIMSASHNPGGPGASRAAHALLASACSQVHSRGPVTATWFPATHVATTPFSRCTADTEEDWGIKFNYSSGEPAPEKITDKIYGFTQSISELKARRSWHWRQPSLLLQCTPGRFLRDGALRPHPLHCAGGRHP